MLARRCAYDSTNYYVSAKAGTLPPHLRVSDILVTWQLSHDRWHPIPESMPSCHCLPIIDALPD